MIVPDPGPRFLTQNDRIAIADGLQVKQTVKEIAASIEKSFQTVYREIKRNAKPDGSYHPWWAHNQTLLRRWRPKEEKIRASEPLRTLVREKLTDKWSPQQIARHLAREPAHDPAMRACSERSTGPCSPASSVAARPSSAPAAPAARSSVAVSRR
ncbi:transposase [Streptomyces sp. NPDC127112]|uniref:transposase n=1 Tax=Streptomyces sp. NPDC127112 TaxID=3345364 RepID=UPI00363D604E